MADNLEAMIRVNAILDNDEVVLDSILVTPNLIEILQSRHHNLIQYLSRSRVRIST